MRKIIIIMALAVAGIAAGCGSSSTHTANSTTTVAKAKPKFVMPKANPVGKQACLAIMKDTQDAGHNPYAAFAQLGRDLATLTPTLAPAQQAQVQPIIADVQNYLAAYAAGNVAAMNSMGIGADGKTIGQLCGGVLASS